MSRIFHLHTKSDDSHTYYVSLTGLFRLNKNLGISKFTLDRFDFKNKKFENNICVIRKSFIIPTVRNSGKK